MKNIRKITNDLYYLGATKRSEFLFENLYPVNNSASYNSYLLNDDKTVLFDTVEEGSSLSFFENLDASLNGKDLDYLVVQHIEPDHSALIKEVLMRYSTSKIVCNAKTKQMIYQFFEFANDIEERFHIVKEGDILETGHHKLTFVMAPMVHWPEVMVTYDLEDKILFSADAFGSFGALNLNLFDDEVEFDKLIDEYRRYYTNIVGKYGQQVCALLNKASNLEIKMICPLHGLILRKNISKMVELYLKWASYTPEKKSLLVVYSSVYGNTRKVAEYIGSKIADKGVSDVKIYDASSVHFSYLISEAFKYSHILLASSTHNNNIFSSMEFFVSELVKHNLQNRKFIVVENGSWVPACGNLIKNELEKLKGSEFIENGFKIKSAYKSSQEEQLNDLIDKIFEDLK